MKQSREDKIFTAVNYTVVTIIFGVVLLPLIYIVSASFSDPTMVAAGKVWLWPVGFSLEGYKAVFNNKNIWSGFYNSFYYMIAGTSINVAMTILAAYPLSRKDFFGRNFYMFLFVFSMMFNGGLIPTYLLIKDLGMIDTRWAMLLPMAITVYNVIITRTFFQNTIPDSLTEAAQLDGCSDYRFLWSVVIPLSGPIVAVISLFYAVFHWNQYFQALIYLQKQELYPLQIILRNILVQNQISVDMFDDYDVMMAKENLADLLKYSLIIVASVPVMIIYPFVQKFFVRGVMIGAIKG